MSIKTPVKLWQPESFDSKKTKLVYINSEHFLSSGLAIIPAFTSSRTGFNRCRLSHLCSNQSFIQQLLSFSPGNEPTKIIMNVTVLIGGDDAALHLKESTAEVIGRSPYRWIVVNKLKVEMDKLLPSSSRKDGANLNEIEFSTPFVHKTKTLKVPATYHASAFSRGKDLSLLINMVGPRRRTSVNKLSITERYPASNGLSQIQC